MKNPVDANYHRERSLARQVRLGRFFLVAQMVVRIYSGYKVIQFSRRFFAPQAQAQRYVRHHRRSAELIYRTALRLEGWLVKACQFIGSRADILPPEYIEVLSRLQDRVPPRPFAVIKQRLETELGKPIAEVFSSFSPQPVAAASLAQVHEATLHDGRRVAVKVQYPDIAALVDLDLQNVSFFVEWLARLEPRYDFRFILKELRRYIPLELDFIHEGHNAETVARNFSARRDDAIVPRIYWEYTTRCLLVMEFMEGIKVTDVAALRAAGIDTRTVAQKLTEIYLQQILLDGLFHADPHPGNLLVQPGPRLVFLDFGLTKDLPPEFPTEMVRLTTAIVRQDADEIVASFRRLGFVTKNGGAESLLVLGEAMLGHSVKENKAYADPEMVERFNDEISQAMRKDPIVEAPGDLVLVGRVMGLLSGIGKQLGSEVNLFSTLLPYLVSQKANPDRITPQEASRR
ncbi:MAG: AarF/ABC1/UbiB kinase family protein [Deltaproteobacteria bacterium]|nr:AarF/ABC1/UbiB kinase family protein [Deltaproteobacteria bacterium]